MKHTFRKCLSIVLALATLFGVCVLPLSAAPVSDPKCNHYAYVTDENKAACYVGKQEPTCLTEGGDVYLCPGCNETFVHKDSWVDPLGHDWKEHVDCPKNVAPTYTTTGKQCYKCTRCNTEKLENTDVIGCGVGKHKVVPGSDSATCTTGGRRTDKCEYCGWTQTVDTPALGHVWNDGVVTTRPICGESNGVITFTCTRVGCAATYKVEEVAAINHEWQWLEEDLGSCGVNGHKAAYQCVQCKSWSKDGVKIATDVVIVNPAHNWQQCKDEDHTHTGEMDADYQNGHIAGMIYIRCDNTCHTGDKCVAFNFDPTVYDAPTDHILVAKHVLAYNPDGTVVPPAYMTKVEDDKAQACRFGALYECSCGYTVRATYKPEHKWAADVPPTCTSYGYKSCEVCGATEGYVDMYGNVINPAFNKLNHLPEKYNGIMPEGDAFKALMQELGARYTPATCYEAAYYSYWCPNDGCKYHAGGAAGERYKLVVGEKLEHDVKTVRYEAPTCVEDGVQGGTYCENCTTYGDGKAEATKVLPKLGHTWENAGDAVQDYAETYWTPAELEALDHDKSYWGKVDSNCSYGSHEGVLCGRCNLAKRYGDPGETIRRNFVGGGAATGAHVYIESVCDAVKTAPTCTTPGLIRYYCYYCNTEQSMVDPSAPATGHNWEVVIRVPATCQTTGYDVKFCDKCNNLDKGDTYAFVNEDHDRFISHFKFTGVASEDVTAVHRLDLGGIWQFTLAPDGHDALADDADVSKLNILWDAENATFTVELAEGVKLESIMRTPSDKIGLDDPATSNLEGYDPTMDLGLCGVASYYEWVCEDCKYEYNKHIEDMYGPTGVHASVPKVDAMDCVKNYPGTVGATMCARCGEDLVAGSVGKVVHKIDKTLPGYKPAKKEDCLTAGWDEFGVCTICTAAYQADPTQLQGDYEVDAAGNVLRYNNYRKELGHTVDEDIVPAQKVGCLVPGWDAYYKCKRCDYVVDNTSIDEDAEDQFANVVWVAKADMIASGVTAAELAAGATPINGYVKALGHDWSVSSLVPMVCTANGVLGDGYTWYGCEREGCTTTKVENFQFGWYGHRYTDHHETDVECAESYCLCANKIETVKTDASTGAETAETATCNDKLVLREAIPHESTEGIIDLSHCTNYDKLTDHTCKYCGHEFTVEEYHENCPNCPATYKTVPANCQNVGYTLGSCPDCGKVWIQDKGTDLGDCVKVPLEGDDYVAPTWNKDGYRKEKCVYCDKVYTTTLNAAQAFFEMDITNKFGGTVLVNGGLMAVTVKMTAPGTALYSVKLGVKFNPNVLEWVASDSEVANIFGNNVTEVWCDNNGMDTVEIYAHAQKDANGKMQNIVVNGTENIVTIYFKINPEYYDITALKSAVELEALDFGNIVVNVYDESAFNKATYNEGDEFLQLTYDAANVSDKDAIKVETQVYGSDYPKTAPNKDLNNSDEVGAYRLYVWKLGDLNNDAVVDTVDAGMFYEIIIDENAAYDAQADLNKDGEVNAADFIMMKQYMVSKLSYVELAKAN